jgi:tetratricopeptide (TPR) repeat protein
MSIPRIGLMMIVRNEAAVLPRLAESVAGQIDHWTLVRQLFDAVPGELIEDEWRGFAGSRNVALDAAEPHSDWLLTLDADETLHGDLRSSPFSHAADAIGAEQRWGTLRYWLPRLVRSGIGWRWWARAHEYLQLSGGVGNVTQTEVFWVEHHADGGNRADKFERELALLRQDWDEQPGDARTAFNLARTYDALGQHEESIEWFRRRLDLGGWVEESYFARYSLGLTLLKAGKHDEACGVLWHAWGERPWRAEPLVVLAEHYRTRELWELSWHAVSLAFEHAGALPDGTSDSDTPELLFVDATARAWRAAYEGSICAWYVGEHDRGRRLGEYVLGVADLPAEIRQAVEANRAFYEDGVTG